MHHLMSANGIKVKFKIKRKRRVKVFKVGENISQHNSMTAVKKWNDSSRIQQNGLAKVKIEL